MALQGLQLDDGTVIWLEASDKNYPLDELAEALKPAIEEELAIEESLEEQGRGTRAFPSTQVQQQLSNMQDTIKAYTNYTLNAFRQVAHANVNKVTLEFGVNVGGKAGIPFITEGTVGSNIKVTVECTFPPTNSPSP